LHPSLFQRWKRGLCCPHSSITLKHHRFLFFPQSLPELPTPSVSPCKITPPTRSNILPLHSCARLVRFPVFIPFFYFFCVFLLFLSPRRFYGIHDLRLIFSFFFAYTITGNCAPRVFSSVPILPFCVLPDLVSEAQKVSQIS